MPDMPLPDGDEQEPPSLLSTPNLHLSPPVLTNRYARERDVDPSGEPAKKKQKRFHYPHMVDVVDDPKGDMIIKVGHEEDIGLVRVHKMVLMVTSPVFKRMLGGNFVESSRKFGEEDPLVLDDDRTAFIDFCLMIHNQSKDENQVPLSRAASLAVLFDKYCCTSVLLQNVSWPLREYFGPSLQQVHLDELKAIGLRVEDVMCISYVAGDSKLFSRCTRFIISRTARDRGMKHMKTDMTLLSLLPETLIDDLQAMRTHYLDLLDEAANKPMAEMLEQTHFEYNNPCILWEKTVTQFTMEMCRLKGKKFKMSDSLLTLASAWTGLTQTVAKAGSIGPKLGVQAVCHCNTGLCHVPIGPLVVKAVNQNQKALTGLCLECTKLGKSPLEECDHEVVA